MIRCGWCHQPAEPPRCRACGHDDPAKPWLQRGEEPPQILTDTGRPANDEAEIRHRYAEAKATLTDTGRVATVEAIAEQLDRSPRTVREWRKRYGLR
jgi:hypothetical protein